MKVFRYMPSVLVFMVVGILLVMPWESWWQLNLANLELISDRSPEAIPRLEILAERGFEPAQQRLADLEIAAGDLSPAEARLAALQQPDAISWYALGFGYWIREDVPAAQRAWERFIDRHPRGLYNLLWYVQTSGLGLRDQLRPVIAELASQAVEVAPNYELAYLLLGDMVFDDDPIRAERVYRLAVERFPYSSDARLRLADLLITQDRAVPEAVELIRYAIELGSEQPATYALMGQALEALGKGREAIPWYILAVDAGQKNQQRNLQLLQNACQQYGPADGCP